jgi:hypothetical protein
MTKAVDLAAVGSNANSSGTLLISGTAVSASGTSFDLTGIPSWAKRVTVLYAGLSLNTGGVNPITFRLGTSGGIVATGYLGSQGYVGGPPASTLMSTGFELYQDTAADTLSGALTLQLLNPATNHWVATGIAGATNAAYLRYIGGHVTLSGALTQIRVTTGNGTATFDAGTVNIMWE